MRLAASRRAVRVLRSRHKRLFAHFFLPPAFPLSALAIPPHIHLLLLRASDFTVNSFRESVPRTLAQRLQDSDSQSVCCFNSPPPHTSISCNSILRWRATRSG